MVKIIKLVIPGEPLGKGRPRLGKYGIHTPQKTLNYENWVQWIFRESKQEMLEGQLAADITAFYSIPASDSKIKQQKKRDNEIRPTKKPDADNVAKVILDSLNKLAYKDDSQVVSLTVDKYYSDEPRVEIQLYTL